MNADAETIYTGPPNGWIEVGDPGLICNLDGYVPGGVDGQLRSQPVWTRHAGWEFNGRVWWQDGRVSRSPPTNRRPPSSPPAPAVAGSGGSPWTPPGGATTTGALHARHPTPHPTIT